jgi:hypothetical protein
MPIAETESEASRHGWAPYEEDLPGTWEKIPDGEQTRAFARVTVNGPFNEHRDGLGTVLADGDRVALIYPFVFCVSGASWRDRNEESVGSLLRFGAAGELRRGLSRK